MSTSKQVKQVAIQLGTYDTSFTPILQYESPKLYDIWNFDGRWRTDWQGGSANTRSLSGFDRVGVGGYRLDLRITFRNMSPSQAEKLRNLLNDIFFIPEFPRIIRISPDEEMTEGGGVLAANKGDLCNIRSTAYGIRRELTVGRQAVNFQFSGLLRLKTIPDTYTIGTG